MIPVVDNLDELPYQVREAFEQIEVAAGASWNKNHRGDGSHGHVVARSYGVAQDAVITPAALLSSVNDYMPVGITNASVLRLSASGASRDITGIVAPRTRMYLDLWNIGSTQNIVLQHNDTGSLPANRILGIGGADVTINPGDGVQLWYDFITERWRVRGL